MGDRILIVHTHEENRRGLMELVRTMVPHAQAVLGASDLQSVREAIEAEKPDTIISNASEFLVKAFAEAKLAGVSHFAICTMLDASNHLKAVVHSYDKDGVVVQLDQLRERGSFSRDYPVLKEFVNRPI